MSNLLGIPSAMSDKREREEGALVAADRCDTRDCGAPAMVEIATVKKDPITLERLNEVGYLLFCNHHFDVHAMALAAGAVVVRVRPQEYADAQS